MKAQEDSSGPELLEVWCWAEQHICKRWSILKAPCVQNHARAHIDSPISFVNLSPSFGNARCTSADSWFCSLLCWGLPLLWYLAVIFNCTECYSSLLHRAADHLCAFKAYTDRKRQYYISKMNSSMCLMMPAHCWSAERFGTLSHLSACRTASLLQGKLHKWHLLCTCSHPSAHCTICVLYPQMHILGDIQYKSQLVITCN